MALLQTDDSNHQISANTIMSAHPFDVVVVVVVVSVSVVVSSADVAIQRLCVRNEVPILMQVITVIATDADIVDIVIHAEGVVMQLQVVQNAKVIIELSLTSVLVIVIATAAAAVAVTIAVAVSAARYKAAQYCSHDDDSQPGCHCHWNCCSHYCNNCSCQLRYRCLTSCRSCRNIC